eukprot:gnl/TRDRNA2_/TRDRNA2_62029_c0_seq1.p1 gnl/TRDRNA2_/TRDRNA2_62029_c0~~gnl/TRDRNA2_/TRDRNA2_62029_c0_seq1.p1  ORF type:complete len:594 (+),score=94.28 gnl/TRDRNA2_/TRDRNA2_62029_c0_seq1:198-1784(+)
MLRHSPEDEVSFTKVTTVADQQHDTAAAADLQAPAADDQKAPASVRHGPSQISVILACADEGTYAVKTAVKVLHRTPKDRLREIIVVDDGSKQPMDRVFAKAGFDESKRAKKKIKIIRHKETLGLMIAKKTGGDAAVGDILVFFDCHVSPQKDWYKEISQLIDENPQRMVVPAITDLDLDTWEEKEDTSVNTKCYLTWDADFNWFDDPSPEVPVMSGGLLALSASWWKATGGYDSAMRGWGGENLDQSLRAWLCGGEILRAKSSRVAHMWRTDDRRTVARYEHVSGPNNRLRVVAAWYDVFRAKYPHGEESLQQEGLDVSNIDEVKQKLHCKPFVHFLHHFRNIYVNGGILTPRVFQLREIVSGLCLTLQGESNVALAQCLPGSSEEISASHGGEDTLFHWANRDQTVEQSGSKDATTCCSGLRQWGANMCLDYADDDNNVHPYLCDVTGSNLNQQYRLLKSGKVSHNDGRCLSMRESDENGPTVGLFDCEKHDVSTWEEITPFEPVETKLYKEQLAMQDLKDPMFRP